MPSAYQRLCALAGSYLRNERADDTPAATALVHEAFIRLVEHGHTGWKDRAHFLAAAAGAMRHILVDYSRKRHTAKHGGGRRRVSLVGLYSPTGDARSIDLLALEEALSRLTAVYPKGARVVELRFLSGLSVGETAAALGVSASTVEREWRIARTWLRCELSGAPPA